MVFKVIRKVNVRLNFEVWNEVCFGIKFNQYL